MAPLVARWGRKRPPWPRTPTVVRTFTLELLGERVLTDSSRIGAPDYWEESQSGPSTSTFYAVRAQAWSSLCNYANTFPRQDVRPQYLSGTGPTRTRPIQTGQFQPYGASRARANEHRNMEAGPSTLVPPPVPYVGPPTQPSGGSSKTAADAATNQSTREEDKTPVSNFYCSHILHVTEWSSGVRPPSRPSSLAAKDCLARNASKRREILVSCAPG